MSENTIYLLYNTNATDVKVHQGSRTEMNKHRANKEWEYVDRDEFTITYNLEDVRKYTDVQILSKTKLKERPKSAHQLGNKIKGSVEGILIKRANSLSTIEGDLFVKKKSPLIKPLLSETEITRLQQMQEECRRKKFERDNKGPIPFKEKDKEKNLSQVNNENLNFMSTSEDLKDLIYNLEPKYNRKELRQSGPPEIKSGASKSKLVSSESEKTSKKILHLKKPQVDMINSRTIKQKEKHQQSHLDNKRRTSNQLKPDRTKTEQIENRQKSMNLKNKKSHENGLKSMSGSTEKQNRTDSDHRKEKSKQKTKPDHSQYDELDHSADSKQKETTKSKQSEFTKKPQANKNEGDTTDDEKKLKTKQKTSLKEKTMEAKSKTDIENDKEPSKDSKKNRKGKETKSKGIEGEESAGQASSKASSTANKSEKSSKTDKVDSKKHRTSIGNSEKSSGFFENVVGDKKKQHTKFQEDKSLRPSKDEINTSQGKLKSQNKVSPKKGFEESEQNGLVLKQPTSRKRISGEDVEIGTKSTLSKPEKSKEQMTPTKGKKVSNLFQYMIQYILSNPVFIKLGWTLKPTDPLVSRLVTFMAEPANPHNYFMKRDEAEIKYYPSGILALNISEDGNSRINYPSGSPAVIVTKKELFSLMTLYSDPKTDPMMRDSHYNTVLGKFDSFGNGVVYDNKGGKVLKLNQMEGIYNNPARGTPYKWQWGSYKVLEKHRTKALLASMVKAVKSSPPPSTIKGKTAAASAGSTKKSEVEKKPETDKAYEALLAELPSPVPPSVKVKKTIHKSGFKPIILKINNEMTLRINEQDNIILTFSAKSFSYKIYLGVRVVPDIVEQIYDVPEIKTNDFPSYFDAIE